MGFSDALDIGTNLFGAYTEYSKGQAVSGIIGHERKVDQINTDLELRSADKRRRSAVGAEISRAAGSGLQLNLEDLARMESEYLMDEAVIIEESRISQEVSRSNQKAAKNIGKTKTIDRLYQSGKGINKAVLKTQYGQKLEEKFLGKMVDGKREGGTKLGAWLQR